MSAGVRFDCKIGFIFHHNLAPQAARNLKLRKKIMLTIHWTSLVVLNFSNELSSYPAGKTYMCYILTQEKVVVLFGI